jgi:hypothetical protein
MDELTFAKDLRLILLRRFGMLRAKAPHTHFGRNKITAEFIVYRVKW